MRELRLKEVIFLVQGYQLETGIKSRVADPKAGVSHITHACGCACACGCYAA